MADILETIVAHKRLEVASAKELLAPRDLYREVEQLLTDAPTPRRSMRQSLATSPSGIIAEYKRRSPSKGWIHEEAVCTDVVPAYERAGAAAVSVLTDEHFFGGSQQFLRQVRPLVSLPLLRKDFIIDEYQLFEARAIGADAVLLIAACLPLTDCRTLLHTAHELGLEVLLEVHSEPELRYAECGADMVGVNNRHLGTFVTEVSTSFEIASLLPQGSADSPLLVSESGISDPKTITELRQVGYRGFLIGETFMRAASPGEALASFIKGIQS